jgi:4-hydroxyphenylpyruvate dioxygenase
MPCLQKPRLQKPRLPLAPHQPHAPSTSHNTATPRPTIFVEIIQRVGCTKEVTAATPAPGKEAAFFSAAAEAAAHGTGDIVSRGPGGAAVEQAAGCGGFGKGNFGALFLSIEEYERTLNV